MALTGQNIAKGGMHSRSRSPYPYLATTTPYRFGSCGSLLPWFVRVGEVGKSRCTVGTKRMSLPPQVVQRGRIRDVGKKCKKPKKF